MSNNGGVSRVQRELNELREKGLATNQRDKYKDLTVAVTTPEEAAAFLAAMRDKSRAGVRVQPPRNLSADGYDAWFLQQKARERELRRKRQEAENMLHGYRSSLSHQKLLVTEDGKHRELLSPVNLFDGGEEPMDSIQEDGWVDFDESGGSEGVGRLDLSAYFNSPVNEAKGSHREAGKLNASVDSENSDAATPVQPETKHNSPEGRAVAFEDVENSDAATPAQPEMDHNTSEGRAVAFEDAASTEILVMTPSRDEEEKKMEGEEAEKRREKERPVPTPAKHLLPDETAWRDFVSSEEGAKFPPESGRYHLYASSADPGSHRVLIVRALKGLEDVISVTIVHPTWRRTRPDDPEDGHRGWVFGDPNGVPFTNTSGRGGPFPACFPGNEPDPIFHAYSVKEIYENANDTAMRYTVPILWDKKLNTIVNNESSDIAYMLNSRFNDFAKNVSFDLYTEADDEKLDEIDDWIQPLMINGVYRCGFAKTQAAYDSAITELTNAFDKADAVLQKQRFLAGDTLTDADVRLFVTLFRFDEVYAFYFKTNTRLVMLTPSLLNYCREIYQMEGMAATCDMEQIKAHFFGSHAELNKFSIIPRGLGFTELLTQPHNRNEIGAAEEVCGGQSVGTD